MALIRPFPGLRPAPEYAAGVLAPPYDVLSSDEARARAAGKRFSFLHVSKPEIDLAPGVDPFDPRVYARGGDNFRRFLSAGVIRRDPAPCYYFYRLTMGRHVQTGLVAAASCAAYAAGRIARHEHTRPDKEDDRVRQIAALNAQTGPVLVTYRHQDTIDALAREATAEAPVVDVTADDSVQHTLWIVSAPARQAALTRAFEALDRLYIADGHHRCAAALRVAEQRRAADPGRTGEQAYDYFLAVMFPDDQVQILDYNRVVRDLNGVAPEAFLKCVQAAGFEVEPWPQPLRPGGRGEFGMYLARRWYRLRVPAARVPDDPVRRLDASLLQERIVGPLLGVADPRRDERIDFVGGARGLDALTRRVDSGEMAAAFALHPTSVSEMMAVADAGEVMPPKSTWFEPKLADGMVSHALD